MEVSFSSSFKRALKRKTKANPKTENEFWLSLQLFVNDPFDPSLKTHKLSGKLRYLWSFTVDHNNRVIFYFTNDNPKRAVLIDLGTHDEVY